MFQVVGMYYSLKSCYGVPKLFRLGSVTVILLKDLSCQNKRCCMLSSMGLDLFSGGDCNDIASSEGTFTVMFETMTVQNKKQMTTKKQKTKNKSTCWFAIKTKVKA